MLIGGVNTLYPKLTGRLPLSARSLVVWGKVAVMLRCPLYNEFAKKGFVCDWVGAMRDRQNRVFPIIVLWRDHICDTIAALKNVY